MGSLTINQKTNYIGFPKAAELIEITGAHQLEASDRALQNMLLQVAHDSGRITEPDAEWELTFASIRTALSKHESNDRVRASLERLMNVQVTVHYKAKTGEPRTQKTHLLEFIDTGDGESGNATVQFGIPKKLRLLLARSNRWGRVRCEVAYAMTSKYAIALYELLCLRANMEQCAESFPIDRFRELLGVPPGTYALGADFVRKVIEPAVLEVNGLSDMGVKIELRRRHTRAPVDRVDMAWWRQQGDEYRASMEERQRHKSGRKARLRNKVETVAADEAG
jgi:Initiator Replication protein